MRVRDRQPVEHALDRAILAEAAMQRVEHRIRTRAEGGDDSAQVLADFDLGDVESGFTQRTDHLRRRSTG